MVAQKKKIQEILLIENIEIIKDLEIKKFLEIYKEKEKGMNMDQKF